VNVHELGVIGPALTSTALLPVASKVAVVPAVTGAIGDVLQFVPAL
jgi:hypothetical protein